MAPEAIHHPNRSTSCPAPAEGGQRGVPLLALVLSGALRLRSGGEEAAAEPGGDVD